MLKAFRVVTNDEVEVIYAAKSAGQARFAVWDTAQEFSRPYMFGDIRVKRAKTFDDAAAALGDKCGPISLGWRDGRDSWGVLR